MFMLITEEHYTVRMPFEKIPTKQVYYLPNVTFIN